MPNNFLAQEEIDALLKKDENAGKDETDIESVDTDIDSTTADIDDSDGEGADSEGVGVEILDEIEKDALGEIGNISMGSAATTLSELLGKRVVITSPRVLINSAKNLYEGFTVPKLLVKVRFKEGLIGYNLLIIRIRDAAVLADLMMGGDGTKTTDTLSEMEISAASEAMNQMIGTAATSLASMFRRDINILPPESIVLDKKEDIDYQSIIEDDEVVMVEFRMTIEDLLDTQIMQIMGVGTAKEKAVLLLGGFVDESSEADPPDAQEKPMEPEIPLEPELPLEAELPLEPEMPAWSDTTGGQVAAAAETLTPPATMDIPVPPPSGFTQDGSFDQAISAFDKSKLELLLDIPLKVTVVLGRSKRPIREVLNMTSGSIVELEALVDEPVEVQVNGTLVARGEVVVVNENFGVRITEILSPTERLQQLRH